MTFDWIFLAVWGWLMVAWLFVRDVATGQPATAELNQLRAENEALRQELEHQRKAVNRAYTGLHEGRGRM